MRLLSLLLLFSLGCFASVANAQHAPSKKVQVKKAGKKAIPAKAAIPTSAGPVLTFERTPCFGTCPGYKMEVFADGHVAYEGRRAVPLMGKRALKLPASTVAEMLRQAKQAHFATFENEYKSGATDMPSTIVAIRQADGTLKKVVAESNIPENVKGYFTYLATQFDQLAQLNDVGK